MKLAKLFPLLLVIVLLAAACAPAAAPAPAAPEAATEAATEAAVEAPAAAMPEMADIVDTAVSAGSFNTLVAAVEAAGLVDTLKGEGPFTVFAPTDGYHACCLLFVLSCQPAELLHLAVEHLRRHLERQRPEELLHRRQGDSRQQIHAVAILPP